MALPRERPSAPTFLPAPPPAALTARLGPLARRRLARLGATWRWVPPTAVRHHEGRLRQPARAASDTQI